MTVRTYGADESTNFRGTGRAERSTSRSDHDETPLSHSPRPDVSKGNGEMQENPMAKADTKEQVQARVDEIGIGRGLRRYGRGEGV